MTTLNGFLLGVIVTASLAASAFFFKFWTKTHDRLFLAFSAAFLIEGLNRLGFLWYGTPNEAGPAVYVVRFIAFALIIAGIVSKRL